MYTKTMFLIIPRRRYSNNWFNRCPYMSEETSLQKRLGTVSGTGCHTYYPVIHGTTYHIQ